MRRAVVVFLVVALVLTLSAPPARACVECVALGLASFAVFTHLVAALAAPPVVYARPGYYYPSGYPAAYGYPAVYGPVPTYATGAYAYAPASPPAWSGPRVVLYPHGRYELQGDGVSTPYAWVWIPRAAPAPPAPAAPAGAGGRTP